MRVAPGAFAQEGALLFHIADRSALWLELRVAESDAARLASPAGAAFRVGAEAMQKVHSPSPNTEYSPNWPARLAILTLAPSSAAMTPARCATSMEWLSTFWP